MTCVGWIISQSKLGFIRSTPLCFCGLTKTALQYHLRIQNLENLWKPHPFSHLEETAGLLVSESPQKPQGGAAIVLNSCLAVHKLHKRPSATQSFSEIPSGKVRTTMLALAVLCSHHLTMYTVK